MKTYKLFRYKNGNLYPLYVEAKREIPIGTRIEAHVGEKVDETHVKGCGGKLSLRPGFHSTKIPFTDWIGKKGSDGKLYQRKGTVWCECSVIGKKQIVKDKNGSRTIPNGWYEFITNMKQTEPWIISDNIKVNRILSHEEVVEICKAHGIEAQRMEAI